MTRTIVATLVLLAAASARAQTAQPQPQPQPQPPPQQPQQPQQPPAAGTTQAPPSSGSSQQVVVNPPAQQPPQPAQPAQPQPPPPGTSTTVVTPPPPTTTVVTPTQAERERRATRSPMAIVAMDALYGGLAGLLVGGGIALINDGDNWGRTLMIGAGSGILVGTAVGAVHAYSVNRDDEVRRVAFDGQGSTVRDPVIKRRPLFAIGGRF